MIALDKPVTSLGRKQADILIDDVRASSRHAEIRLEGAHFVLLDLKSTNGTYVNRSPVSRTVLQDQDVIEIGATSLCFFADRREFHGSDEQEGSLTSESGESVTTTQTLQQLGVKIEILVGPDAGKVLRFKKSHITLGRSDADVVLLDADVSRAHAIIEVLGPNAVFVRDLGSTNGTNMKNKRIEFEKIQSGDEIQVGNCRLKLSFEAENS